MISFACPGCGKKLKVKEEIAGKKVKCNGCAQLVQVPGTVSKPAADGSVQLLSVTPAPKTSDVEDDDSATPYGLAEESVPNVKKQTGLAGGKGAGPTESFKEAWNFLRPPEGPGEIGRLGPYRILKVLGQGGMGVVFRGEDPALQRPVAIKAMLPELAGSRDAKERFFREARAAAGLKHPNIVSIYQVGEDQGAPFLAMEFLEGESLQDRLDRERKLPIPEVLRIGRELAVGLGAAHDKGLVHRDIKPANIWLEGEEARAKILDFGLARVTSEKGQLTQSGAILGTPAYMAPEQAAGIKADHRADLFSMGSVLYCMACGERPFKGHDVMSLLTALAVQNPTPPIQLNPDMPVELSDLILKLLAKDPRKRPQSADEVVQALKKLRKRQKTDQPKRPSPAVLVGAGVGIALVVVLIFSLLFGGSKGEIAVEPKGPNDSPAKRPVAQTELKEPAASPPKTEPVEKVIEKPEPKPVTPDVPKKPEEVDPFAFLKTTTAARRLSGPEIFEKVLKSAVCIISDGGNGSGALINKDERLVVTNHHVVQSTNNAVLKVGMGKSVPAAPFKDVPGRLDASCPIDRVQKTRCRYHPLTMSVGDKYIIDLLSTDFDSVLRIEDSLGQQLAYDDDSGGNLNSRITFTAPRNDTYKIIATALTPVKVGNYVLRLTPLEVRRPAAPAAADNQFVYVLFPKYQSGKLVTASKEYLQGTLAAKERYKAKVLFSDESKDLAIVQLSDLPSEVEALPLAAESAKQGQTVYSVGNPGAGSTGPGPFAGPGPSVSSSGSFWVFTAGTVRNNPSAKQWGSGGATAMKHNATIIETQSLTSLGDSGGPLVNEWGELVAVTQGSNLEGGPGSGFGGFGSQIKWANLFIDVSEVKAILQAKGHRWVDPAKEPQLVRTNLTTYDVQKLIALLGDESSKIRLEAAMRLGDGEARSRGAAPALGKSLSDITPEVRRAAAGALGAIGAEALAALPQLGQALKDTDRPVRAEAMKAILKIGPQGRELATALGEVLTDTDADLQQQALTALGKTGADAKHALPGLRKWIEGSDVKLQKLALTMIEQLGPEAREATPSLQKLLTKADADTKNRVLRLLVDWTKTADAGKTLVPQLVESLKDTDKTACLTALKSLASLGKAAEPAAGDIDFLYRRTKDRDVRSQSLETLAAMGPAAKQAVPTLVIDVQKTELRRDDKALHDQVRQTLVKIGVPAAAALTKLLADGKLGEGKLPQRKIVYEIIGEIGPEAASVSLPALINQRGRETDLVMLKLLNATIDQLRR